ncbi:hypothetical protein [Lederbergia citri]|uniref:Uncharacterized protein n=1 Tax=Lederbergia citri TaxID=2833580 RepID=A0A942YHV7_9BACI|nr:hypothetical protein [Lederbergia citri]MBS4195800.1 hypothetical protein [Lederbergia citri]
MKMSKVEAESLAKKGIELSKKYGIPLKKRKNEKVLTRNLNGWDNLPMLI